MSNKNLVPEAKEGLNRFKMEAANEVGVNLKQGYNGDLTAKQAGSIGGQKIKNITPIRTSKRISFERTSRSADRHKTTVSYIASLII